jgi:hypothetical protein
MDVFIPDDGFNVKSVNPAINQSPARAGMSRPVGASRKPLFHFQAHPSKTHVVCFRLIYLLLVLCGSPGMLQFSLSCIHDVKKA